LFPSWHFFYLQALQSVLFGVGVATLVGRFLNRRFKVLLAALAERPTKRQWRYLALASALPSAFVLTDYSRYAGRAELVDNRKEPLFYGAQPAGRKLVALPDLFSNPFVALKPRANDSARLFADLETGNESDFRALARKVRRSLRGACCKKARHCQPQSPLAPRLQVRSPARPGHLRDQGRVLRHPKSALGFARQPLAPDTVQRSGHDSRDKRQARP
jgi:hypothetical protein